MTNVVKFPPVFLSTFLLSMSSSAWILCCDKRTFGLSSVGALRGRGAGEGSAHLGAPPKLIASRGGLHLEGFTVSRPHWPVGFGADAWPCPALPLSPGEDQEDYAAGRGGGGESCANPTLDCDAAVMRAWSKPRQCMLQPVGSATLMGREVLGKGKRGWGREGGGLVDWRGSSLLSSSLLMRQC